MEIPNIVTFFLMSMGVVIAIVRFYDYEDNTSPWNFVAAVFFDLFLMSQLWPMTKMSLQAFLGFDKASMTFSVRRAPSPPPPLLPPPPPYDARHTTVPTSPHYTIPLTTTPPNHHTTPRPRHPQTNIVVSLALVGVIVFVQMWEVTRQALYSCDTDDE